MSNDDSKIASPKKKVGGGFFSVSAGAVDLIARTMGEEGMLAYLVLARFGWGGSDPFRTTAGVDSIRKALCISRARAEKILALLEGITVGDALHHRVVVPATVWHAGKTDLPSGAFRKGKFFLRMLPNHGEARIYIPNDFVDGYAAGKARTPIQRLARIDEDNRLDAIRLLMRLYEHLSIDDFGGSDPSQTIYQKWRDSGELEGREGVTLGRLGTAGGFMFTWSAPNTLHTKAATIYAVTDTVDETDQEKIEAVTERYWEALRALIGAGLVVKSAIVFAIDPSDGGLHPRALYRLWDFGKRERDKFDGDTVRNVNNAVSRAGLSDDYSRLSELPDFTSGLITRYGVHDFVWAAPSSKPRSVVLTVYRPKFIPMTPQVIEGLNRLGADTDKTKRALDNVNAKK